MKNIFVLFFALLLFAYCVFPALAAWQRDEANVDEEFVPIVPEPSLEPGQVVPRKAEIDTNGDGSVDRIEQYKASGEIESIKSDIDFDGVYDEWLYYENGKLIKAAKDTDGDGKEDTWLTY